MTELFGPSREVPTLRGSSDRCARRWERFATQNGECDAERQFVPRDSVSHRLRSRFLEEARPSGVLLAPVGLEGVEALAKIAEQPLALGVCRERFRDRVEAHGLHLCVRHV